MELNREALDAHIQQVTNGKKTIADVQSVSAIITVTRSETGIIEHYGVVSFWHKNPWVRLGWHIKNRLKTLFGKRFTEEKPPAP
jgi:hypothetical protein